MININLLPQGNVRNKAPFFVTLFFIIMLIVGVIVLSILHVTAAGKVETVKKEQMSTQLLLAKKQNTFESLKNQQALEMKEKLSEIKQKGYEFTPLLQQINKVVIDNQFHMTSLNLHFSDGSGTDAMAEQPPEQDVDNENLTSKGEIVIPSELIIEGVSMEGIGAIVEELETIEWIEKAQFKSFNGEKGSIVPVYLSSSIIIYIVPERLPIKGGAAS